MTPRPDPAPHDDDEIVLDDSVIATPPRYLTVDEIVRLVREAQDLPAPPLPGTPEYTAIVDTVRRETEARTGPRLDMVLNLDGVEDR